MPYTSPNHSDICPFTPMYLGSWWELELGHSDHMSQEALHGQLGFVYSTANYWLNHCWLVINEIHRNQFRKMNGTAKLFFQENASKMSYVYPRFNSYALFCRPELLITPEQSWCAPSLRRQWAAAIQLLRPPFVDGPRRAVFSSRPCELCVLVRSSPVVLGLLRDAL